MTAAQPPQTSAPPDAEAVAVHLDELQQRLCAGLEELDGTGRFSEDRWRHEHGTGGGRTRVLRDGAVLEQAGVNYSNLGGAKLPAAASAQRPQLAGMAFRAMGVSVVLHPHNPYVPSAHFNVRFLCVSGKGRDTTWWFGGGFDLTPYYGFTEDAQHWHRNARAACEPFGGRCYTTFKAHCDRYFHIPHRNEARGVGGLFFDDLNEGGFERCFALCGSIGDHFLPGWLPIARRRKDTPYGERQRAFQLYRRGRYVEFNLVYDRGTLFGLQSGGRTESILMSLPPAVAWRYNWRPEAGSEEEALYRDFLPPRNWLA